MNEKKGLIIGTFPGSLIGVSSGGVATHIEGLMSELDKRGIDTKICYHKPFGVTHPRVIKNTKSEWFKCVSAGILGLVRIGFPLKDWDRKTILFFAYYYGALKDFLKSYNPDFIHVHSLYNPAAMLLNHLGYGDKLIITDHGFRLRLDFMENRMAQKLCRANFGAAKKVIYISNIYQKFHEESQLGNQDKLVKIPNPTDFTHYPIKKNTNKGKKEILFNGMKESLYTKGLKPLLEALSLDYEFSKKVRLTAICNEEAQRYVQSNNWPFEYRLYGPLKFNEVLNLYTEADLLATPSRFESFGLVYTEALAVGIPVVGYYGTMDEFQKVIGLYIGESSDIIKEPVEVLLKKIKNALSTPFDREAVRKSLIKNYSWDDLFQKFYSLYYPNE